MELSSQLQTPDALHPVPAG